MENNVVLKEKFDVLIPAETIDFIKKFKEMEARFKVLDDEIKEKAKEFLEQNNLVEEGYEQDGIKFAYVKPYTRRQVDTKKMKDEGIYDEYSYEKEYSGYAKYSVNYEDE